MSVNQLKKSDLNKVSSLYNERVRLLGSRPAWSVSASRLDKALELIAKSGDVVNVLLSEILTSFAVVVFIVLFSVLEFERVYHGAVALQQGKTSSILLAGCLVGFNSLFPAYRLRASRVAGRVVVRRTTLRSFGLAVKNFCIGYEREIEVDKDYNPVLPLVARLSTLATLLLAVYAVLNGYLGSAVSWAGFFQQVTSPAELFKALGGLASSFVGVFGLQTISHEIGVRTLTSGIEGKRAALLAAQKEYDDTCASLYNEVLGEYVEGLQPVSEDDYQGVQVALPFSSNGKNHN